MADDKAPTGGAGDVPDLDMPARAPKGTAAKPAAASPAPAPVAKAKAPAQAIHGALDDPGARNFDEDEDVYGGGAPIDLDLSQGPPMISAQVPVPSAGRQSVGKMAAVRPSGSPPNEGAKAPVHSAMDRRSVPEGDVDPFEARALSDYGDPPEQWWKTPLYAYRVLRRRPELKKRAAAKKREADRAEGAAEDALLAYAELVRPAAQKLGAYGGVFADVRKTESVLRERDAVLAAEADAHKARQAQHDAKLAELEAQLSQIQIEERQIAGEFSEADMLAKRADARAKRVEIEMRNAIAQAGGEEPADPKGSV